MAMRRICYENEINHKLSDTVKEAKGLVLFETHSEFAGTNFNTATIRCIGW
jgi:hypothetical protein